MSQTKPLPRALAFGVATNPMAALELAAHKIEQEALATIAARRAVRGSGTLEQLRGAIHDRFTYGSARDRVTFLYAASFGDGCPVHFWFAQLFLPMPKIEPLAAGSAAALGA